MGRRWGGVRKWDSLVGVLLGARNQFLTMLFAGCGCFFAGMLASIEFSFIFSSLLSTSFFFFSLFILSSVSFITSPNQN